MPACRTRSQCSLRLRGAHVRMISVRGGSEVGTRRAHYCPERVRLVGGEVQRRLQPFDDAGLVLPRAVDYGPRDAQMIVLPRAECRVFGGGEVILIAASQGMQREPVDQQ